MQPKAARLENKWEKYKLMRFKSWEKMKKISGKLITNIELCILRHLNWKLSMEIKYKLTRPRAIKVGK